MELIIQLLGGAIGGYLAGKTFKGIDLGALWNSIAGIIGGGLGGQLLGTLGIGAAPSGEMDIASILGNVVSGGVGGGVLMAIVGAIKKAMVKK